ncbi:MAG TPA: histone deacetylase [Casimicrobiaceae bacterium]|nr:histone deacetylase [Casimicrobiaceae bacterium]
MLIYSASHFVLPLPATHRFPMRKYALLHERIAARAPEFLRVPAAVENAELANAHSTDYVAAVTEGSLTPSSLKRIGFPWSSSMVERSRRSAGATLGACRGALASSCGINLAGGTHHAHRDHGAGFCVFNDAAVAIRTLQAEGRIERALVIDLDVHQGDGTAAIFAEEPAVFTFSMHGRGNFPFIKAASSLDIELADGTDDREYLTILSLALEQVLSVPKPEIAIYLAGADPYVGDRLGRLSLSKLGLATRDRHVLETLRRHGVPVAIVMAGGYADKIEDVVEIHATTVEIALTLFEPAFA